MMLEETWWQAVLTRDRGADGTFVYGVRSTGVYCRPSCPARRPGREQVVFFPQPAAAEEAGFRACRRCHPRDVDAQQRWSKPPAVISKRTWRARCRWPCWARWSGPAPIICTACSSG